MKKYRVTIVLVSIFCMWVSFASAGAYDGEWEGATDSGEHVRFTIEDNIITYLNYGASYQCPTGATQHWGHGRHADTEIVNNSFVIYSEITGNAIESGKSFPAIISGQFQTTDAAYGDIQAAVSAFTGAGLSTMPCSFIDNWTATRILPYSEKTAKEVYNIPLD